MKQKTADRIVLSLSILCTILIMILGTVSFVQIKINAIEIFKQKVRISSLERDLDKYKRQNIKANSEVEYDKPNEFKDIHRKIKSEKRIKVLVTAYNSIEGQTDDTPFEAAWGDELKDGMRIIAVSRDLEKNHGLTKGSIVYIEGLGKYEVLDRMNKRKKNQIDIYMGIDVKKAIKFGRKTLEIKLINNKGDNV